MVARIGERGRLEAVDAVRLERLAQQAVFSAGNRCPAGSGSVWWSQ